MKFAELQGLRWDDIPIIGIDVETTGFSRKDFITEISCVMIRGEEVIDEYTSLVNGGWVSEEITDITGITNEMLEDAPPWEEVEPHVMGMLLRGAPWCAHNMSFDARMIRGHLKGPWPNGIPTICTKIVSRRQVGAKVESHSLKPMCEYLGIKLEGWHRARADALAAALVARKLTAGRTVPDLVTRASEDWPA